MFALHQSDGKPNVTIFPHRSNAAADRVDAVSETARSGGLPQVWITVMVREATRVFYSIYRIRQVSFLVWIAVSSFHSKVRRLAGLSKHMVGERFYRCLVASAGSRLSAIPLPHLHCTIQANYTTHHSE